MTKAYDYLYFIDQNHPNILSTNEQLTLTDIFHQFDTITLRGRTSIDRYLNIQSNEQPLNIELPQIYDRTRIDTDQRKQILPIQKYYTSSAERK